VYYGVLKLVGKNRQAEHMKKVVNGQVQKYLALYNKQLGFYYPWAWKNHDGDRECGEWFDSLGNLLAIITGLATPAIAKNILDHIEKSRINRPYPVKCLWPTIKPGDKDWHSYFSKCDAREPLHYLNGGVWPMIGGFYVVALIKMKQFAKAEKELTRLAKANLQIIEDGKFPPYLNSVARTKHLKPAELEALRQKEFNEWLTGDTGQPKGEPYQAWSAGAYLYAYHCLRQKKVLYFD
jgi:hypothetical protein